MLFSLYTFHSRIFGKLKPIYHFPETNQSRGIICSVVLRKFGKASLKIQTFQRLKWRKTPKRLGLGACVALCVCVCVRLQEHLSFVVLSFVFFSLLLRVVLSQVHKLNSPMYTYTKTLT